MPPGIFNDCKSASKLQPMVLEESKDFFTGKLKFFDEAKNYGFLVMDEDQTDIFVNLSYAGPF